MNEKNKLPVASPDEAKINLAKKSDPAAPGNESQLPHERDQSLHATDGKVHPEVAQAQKDLKGGLVDTDERAADGRPIGSRRKT